MKIAFVTQASHPEMEEDDRPLAEALARRGALVLSVAWDNPEVAWREFDIALLRSPWDYFSRQAEFLEWMARVDRETRVVNPPKTVRWNINKRYLHELAARAVRVVPTRFLSPGDTVHLADLCRDLGWSTVVLKPAVSADSWETIRVAPDRYAEGDAYLERHRAHREIMVQPFVKDVEQGGEQCLVFFGGQYSHAVTKNSAFRGGRHVGPEGRLIEPRADAMEMARDVLVRAGVGDIAYARVDVARDESGAPMLLELELFEPTLFFREKPGSEVTLADILMR